MADGDPYELFRQTLEGFGSGFEPGGFGMAGWPMTPLPLQGMAGAEMTPEAGTKRAVSQLYRSIETLDDQLLGASTPDGWEQALAGFSSHSPERVVGMLLGTYQLWLHNLSQLLIESYTVRIIYDELVVQGHRNEMGTSEWLLALPQSDREQLLLRCTDVEDDLIAEMERLRKRRNELLYSMGNWEEVALDDPVEDGQRYMALLQGLDERVADGDPFAFLSPDE